MEHNENIENFTPPLRAISTNNRNPGGAVANANRRKNGWPDANEEMLRSLWADGHSCGSIQQKINSALGSSYTRNAIIGKAARIDLPKRQSRIYAVPERAPRKQYTYSKPRVLTGPMIDDAAIPAEQRKTFLQLGRRDCRWPVGDPLAHDFFFCGAPQHDGSSYCLGHTVRSIRHD